MMSGLIARLRQRPISSLYLIDMSDAANEIQRLQGEVERYRSFVADLTEKRSTENSLCFALHVYRKLAELKQLQAITPEHPPQEVIDEWANQCDCCPDCSPVPCGGVTTGGLCDVIECICDDELQEAGSD